MTIKHSVGKPSSSLWFWLGPLIYMLVVGLYFPARFNGHWAEADSSTFTRYIRSFTETGKLLPSPEMTSVYPNGYAYQAISTFVVALTGLEVKTLQQWIYPLLAALVVIPAWIAYRELTSRDMAATLATLLLFTQPECLFVLLRSSHEKFTRMLILLSLFLLVRSLLPNHSSGKRSIYTGLFYLVIFAVITSNYLLANSFILALGMILALGWILSKLRPRLKEVNNSLTHQLRYAVPICFVLIYFFATYVYPPANHNVRVLQNTWDGIAKLFLGAEAQSDEIYNAYGYVLSGWINVPTYFLLSIANWITLIVSFLIWLVQAWKWIWKSAVPKNRMAWLLWLFYTAFAIQEVLAAVSDASGALSSNLQLRLFPSFSMIAVAMIGTAWAEWQPQRYAKVISVGLAGILFCISIFSVLKATNEPLLSNKWNFYHPAEIIALTWADTHIQNGEIWTEYDERIQVAYVTEIGDTTNVINTFVTPATRDMLLSPIIRFRSNRFRQPLPIPPDSLRVYDNGITQVFHLRPRTPYQP